MSRIRLKIIDLTEQGEGLAKTEQKQVVFVPYSIPGDIIEADLIPLKKNIWTAKNIKFIEYSSARINAPCKFFKPISSGLFTGGSSADQEGCGGCQVQQINYPKLLEIKQDSLRHKLKRIAKLNLDLVDFRPIIGMQNPWHYRNNVQLKVKYNHEKNMFEQGFYARGSHDIIVHDQCLISQKTDKIIRLVINKFLQGNSLNTTSRLTKNIKDIFIDNWDELIIRTCENTGEILLAFNFSDFGSELLHSQYNVLWRNLADSINKELQAEDQILTNYELVSIWFLNQKNPQQDICVFGKEFFVKQILTKRFQVFPKAFFQVNTKQTEIMFSIIKDLVRSVLKDYNAISTSPDQDCNLFDLYCGTGTIGIILSDLFTTVKGVELFPAAVMNAKQNAILNQTHNVEFYQDRAEHWLDAHKAKPQDVIIVDPPRSGLARTLIETLNKTEASTLIYVSCHPGTLSRDIKLLKDNWQLKTVQPIDMFPWTMQVECIALIERVKE